MQCQIKQYVNEPTVVKEPSTKLFLTIGAGAYSMAVTALVASAIHDLTIHVAVPHSLI